MYGTVARLRLKPDSEPRMRELMAEYESLQVPGYVRSTVYQLDDDPRDLYLAVVFESRESYRANAESPEQHARFVQMMELLEGEPEWHDGEIVYSG